MIMVNKKTLLVIIPFICIVVISGCKDETDVIAPDIGSKIDLIVEQNIDGTTDPGLTLLVQHDGKIVLQKAYGLANVQTVEAFNVHTPCFIGSVSKQFTATAIMILVERDSVRVEDPIRDYFPEYPEEWDKVTIHHLLSHQSGISDYFNDHGYAFDGMTNTHALEYIFEHGTLHFEPGERFKYSNTGYIILAELVEMVTGKSLAEFCDEEIFSPLGMNNTLFVVDDNQIPPNRAIGHTLAGEVFDYTIRTNGDGGMISTVDDMAKWDRSLDNNPIISQGMLSAMMNPYSDMKNGAFYGYGFIIDNYNGYTLPSQNGGFSGIFAYYGRNKEKKFFICLMANSPDYALFEEIISTILDYYFPKVE
jgi:CubicO group peptidase (beta-lactamase class C family)